MSIGELATDPRSAAGRRVRRTLGVRLVMALAVVLAAVTTGCGGSESSGAAPAEATTSVETTSGSTSTVEGAATEGEDIKVAALFTQSVSQGNWDPAGYAAFTAMAEKYGWDARHVEQASYEKAPAILRDLASEGTQLIILHSSGYAAAVEEVAPDFPDTQFVVFSFALDTKGIPNYSAWSMDWDQVGFVKGAIAALASKSGKIAVFGGEPVPSAERTIEYIERGVKYTNPDIEMTTAYIGSWTDAAKAKELAIQAVNGGADVLIPVADTAGAGVQQAAEENGGLTLGEYIDQSATYPNSVITSTIVDMEGAYDEIGQAFVDGNLNGQIVQMNIESGDLSLVTPFRNVDPAIEERVDEIMSGIADGSIDVQAE